MPAAQADGSDRHVRIYEVGPRDGLQNGGTPISTEAKARFIELLVAAGLREIEATSFVSSRAIPQLGDADALLPARRGEGADIVLCWDLINYLNKPALTAVMECIALRCKRGALAHGLVYYSAKSMPVTDRTRAMMS